jgi:hypothetical protein
MSNAFFNMTFANRFQFCCLGDRSTFVLRPPCCLFLVLFLFLFTLLLLLLLFLCLCAESQAFSMPPFRLRCEGSHASFWDSSVAAALKRQMQRTQKTRQHHPLWLLLLL